MYAHNDFIRHVKRIGSEMIWTRNDTKCSIICSLVPCAISLNSFLYTSNNPNSTKKWNASLPLWIPKDAYIYGLLDVLTMSPIGYAAYRAYKYGGGFMYDDTKIALGLCGITLIFSLFSLPFTKAKNYTSQFRHTLLMHLTALGTTYTFYKLDNKAGLLMIPYAIWTGCYTLLAYALK
ncbi:unnamed protein product [Cercopithifilaria johnstoni]|uniref:TspO/MBR family protein n=1 Tax=Cercopithifilaria johnstoni TaxID=2874296 RepID=A0A8J2MBK3_9BILA|nr:unnamed protein product [Cercopithifilaria johnstoni]